MSTLDMNNKIPSNKAEHAHNHAHNREIRRAKRLTRIYLGLTLFMALFAVIYEYFSHGVLSYHMVLSGAAPLCLGAVPWLLAYRRGEVHFPSRTSHGFWATGIGLVTTGMVMQGVLEIYGTTNHLVWGYIIAAPVFLLLGFVYSRKDSK